MIEVQDLKAGYRSGFSRRWREVLSGVSFSVPRGSVTGYLGVNGAGKTTTIKVLVGINPPAGGTVAIGAHPAGSDEARRLLGYFPEAPFFYDGLTADELLDFYARLSGVPQAVDPARRQVVLAEVGLAEAADRPVGGFSKGMRQRLGLAQALIHEPELLILDEPLDGLDPMGRLQLRELIERQGAQGRTVFFSSHVLSDVEAVCDHLVVLDGGQIAYQGPTDQIASDGAAVPVAVELRQVPADAEGKLAELAGAPLEARAGGRRRVLCPDAATANALADAARAAGAELILLQPERPSLEEYFLARFGQPASGASA